MTLSVKLKQFYNQHKILYTIGILLIIVSRLLALILTYLSFLMLFLTFSGVCCIIYGFLLHLENKKISVLSKAALVLRYTALILIAVFLITQIIIQFKIFSAIECNDVECEYVLVLGAGLINNKPSLALQYRLNTAYEYMTKYPNSKAILCGGLGKGREVTEAYAMQQYLLKKGISNNRLILEEKSTDTTENIYYAKEIIDKINTSDKTEAIVITNRFHLYRATLIMKKAGFNQYHKYPAPLPKIPLLHFNAHLREYFSIILEYMNL